MLKLNLVYTSTIAYVSLESAGIFREESRSTRGEPAGRGSPLGGSGAEPADAGEVSNLIKSMIDLQFLDRNVQFLIILMENLPEN